MFTNLRQEFQNELAGIREQGMYKEEKVISSPQGAEIVVIDDYRPSASAEGDKQKLVNFCGNNYLGLAADPSVDRAAKEGIDQYGYGMASVRFICGTSTIHKDLETEIAKFFGAEDAILYTSCFDANTGLFETILQEGDAVFSDELNHASIIDGIRLCKAERFRYKHSDMADLESKLKEFNSRINADLTQTDAENSSPLPTPPHQREGKKNIGKSSPLGGGGKVGGQRPSRILIATDGVFSMDGDTAKLKEICDLAEKYGALVMVDDSHGSGVLGERGRGSVDGLMGRIDILTSTFGKALGGAGGGFTAGRKEIIEYLRQRSRTTLFSNSLPPVIAAAALYVLRNFDTKFTELRNQLRNNTVYFRTEMEKLGFTLGGDGNHSITPVMLSEEKLATAMASALFAKGIYVRGFTYPVVPKGKARIRVQLSASHTREHLDRALQSFAAVGREFKIIL